MVEQFSEWSEVNDPFKNSLIKGLEYKVGPQKEAEIAEAYTYTGAS